MPTDAKPVLGTVFPGLNNSLRFLKPAISIPYQVGILKLLLRVISVSLNCFCQSQLQFGINTSCHQSCLP
jgi:hypothetical protein